MKATTPVFVTPSPDPYTASFTPYMFDAKTAEHRKMIHRLIRQERRIRDLRIDIDSALSMLDTHGFTAQARSVITVDVSPLSVYRAEVSSDRAFIDWDDEDFRANHDLNCTADIDDAALRLKIDRARRRYTPQGLADLYSELAQACSGYTADGVLFADEVRSLAGVLAAQESFTAYTSDGWVFCCDPQRSFTVRFAEYADDGAYPTDEQIAAERCKDVVDEVEDKTDWKALMDAASTPEEEKAIHAAYMMARAT